MANINNNFSDYVRFWISSETSNSILVKNIIGWNNFGLDAARNLVFQGTLTSVSKVLGFTGEAKEYIEKEFKKEGILCKLSLIVERLTEEEDQVLWVQDEPVYADFYTKDEDGGVLSISFNSNNLMDKIESFEEEDLEVERLTDVFNQNIPAINYKEIDLKSRQVQEIGVSQKSDVYLEDLIDRSSGLFWWTPLTKIISRGPNPHSSVDTEGADGSVTASNMFWVAEKTYQETVDQNLILNFGEIEIQLEIEATFENIESLNAQDISDEKADIRIVKYNRQSTNYVNNTTLKVKDLSSVGSSAPERISISYSTKGTGLTSEFFTAFSLEFPRSYSVVLHYLNIRVFYSPRIFQPLSVKFSFLHDTISRLLYIISGKEDLLYSSVLGRTEKNYIQDGELGLIGSLSGLQARGFSVDSERYSSPQISLKNALRSVSNTFNLGYGVETIDNKEKLIIEDFSYFYRKEIAGKFPVKISNPKRRVDEKSYHVSLEFGYEKGGNYQNEMGLDEPNIKSSFITPIHNTKNKFKKLSNIRADEYGLSELRSKPESTNPLESMTGDKDNWYLDLKRRQNDSSEFEQKEWQDRLSSLPLNIFSAITFRSMFFTPMTILRRFSNIFNSSTYIYKNKFINFASSSSNRNLELDFIGENNSYKENQNILISDLKRPIFKNEIIKFNHPYSEDLRKMLFGKTLVTVGGVERLVPNFYFKFEWINEKNEIERGYFLKYEYEDNPVFEFQIANEEII